MNPKVGDRVSYRSLFGGTFEATIACIRGDGSVDLDVAPPGTGSTMRLRAKWDGEAFTKENL